MPACCWRSPSCVCSRQPVRQQDRHEAHHAHWTGIRAGLVERGCDVPSVQAQGRRPARGRWTVAAPAPELAALHWPVSMGALVHVAAGRNSRNGCHRLEWVPAPLSGLQGRQYAGYHWRYRLPSRRAGYWPPMSVKWWVPRRQRPPRIAPAMRAIDEGVGPSSCSVSPIR